MQFLLDHEATFRLAIFAGVLLLIALFEVLLPRRNLNPSRRLRWRTNLGLVVFNSVLLRVLFPVGAGGVAVFAADRSWGLLNWIEMAEIPEILLSLIILDYALYFQHRVAHAIPLLWRIHRVHHADPHVDVTTGLRFHPLEIVLSWLFKAFVIVVFGVPVIVVIVFELVLNGMAMFNHANVFIPVRFDRKIRLLLVTPDMHRIHHSTIRAEQNSNFGFNLSLWDRIFRTYRAQPTLSHDTMVIGLEETGSKSISCRFLSLIKLPFSRA